MNLQHKWGKFVTKRNEKEQYVEWIKTFLEEFGILYHEENTETYVEITAYISMKNVPALELLITVYDNMYVRFFSILKMDVPLSARMMQVLNEINENEMFANLYWDEDSVCAKYFFGPSLDKESFLNQVMDVLVWFPFECDLLIPDLYRVILNVDEMEEKEIDAT